MAKSIISGPEALHKILAGVNLIADAVKATLGPSGRNCVYERPVTNQPISTRDGVTVANQIDSPDPFENIGVEMVKGVARETVDQSGDGTTTATLLAQAIFSEGVKAITVGANPVALKRGIEKAVAAVVDSLKGMSRPVEGPMLRQVATISANNDEFLGGLIADAIEKAGTDGVVTVEVSRSPESSLDVVEGMQIGTGYLSPYFVNRPEKNECVLEDVYILLHEKKLATILAMRPLLKRLADEGKTLLVIAEDVIDEALGVLSISAKQGPLRCAAVKTPGGVEALEDLAALTGGRVLTELLGVKLKDIDISFLGHAKKIIVKAQSTVIVADSAVNERLNQRKEELRTQITEAQDEGVRLRLQSRLARLAGGVAVIRVGGTTELEMNERKDRIEDAMHAARCAQKEGVVVGGGIALARCSSPENALPGLSGDEKIGAMIVGKACLAPVRTLAENAGKSAEYIEGKIMEWQPKDNPTLEWGWNARTDTFEDLTAAGVIDPVRVVRTALESAASVTALMLITHTLVANSREK
jgi:chaperonin GroEL